MSTDKESSNVSPDFVHLQEEAVLSGYLYKKTRDGRWQRRWFETNGVYLTYYKVESLSISFSDFSLSISLFLLLSFLRKFPFFLCLI
jgi:hypothetical protein